MHCTGAIDLQYDIKVIQIINFFIVIINAQWQGWHSGDRTRLPPMGPGLKSQTRCHKWVEFVVGSRPWSEGFPPSTKINISKF